MTGAYFLCILNSYFYTYLGTKAALLIALPVILTLLATISARPFGQRLILESAETGKVYAEKSVAGGDEVGFEWEHSFEHIPWNEYYEVKKDGTFLLHTISVAGFGAGIPAEMDCTYRYEDGLIYMEGIKSEFPQFNWINSQTALKKITLNGEILVTGADMPQHEKMVLRVK